MGIFDAIRKQLRTVIEWEPSEGTLFELWTEDGDEIKNASTLILKPGQGVIFLYEGKIEGILEKEGSHNLKTDNIPFITTITRIMQSFESEHKVQLFFYWRTEFLDQKWGTTSPIKYDDPIYKFPVGLRAFGNYSFKLVDPKSFFVNIVGSKNVYLIDELRVAINNRIVQPITDLLAESGFSYGEIDKNRNELSDKIKEVSNNEFTTLGYELTDFRLESTNFDEETKKLILKVAEVSTDAVAAERAGLSYAELQNIQALRDAAKNESGGAGAGVGIGAGIGLGNIMATQMTNASPAQKKEPSIEDKLTKLKGLLDKGLINDDEYSDKKAKLLEEL